MKFKPGVHIKQSELTELLLLLDMCQKTYGLGKDLYDELYELYIDRFHELPHGNSRNAGRKKIYGKDKEDEIRKLKEQGLKIKEIATIVNTSASYVHKVVSNI